MAHVVGLALEGRERCKWKKTKGEIIELDGDVQRGLRRATVL